MYVTRIFFYPTKLNFDVLMLFIWRVMLQRIFFEINWQIYQFQYVLNNPTSLKYIKKYKKNSPRRH